MAAIGLGDKLFPVVKIAVVAEVLREEGISPAKALLSTGLSESDLVSPATRISLNQVIQCYRNAIQLSSSPFLAYKAGRRFHVSAFGMYGFAILSSTNFRQTMYFAMKYHELAAPFAEISFKEEGGLGVWTILPLPLPHPEPALHRFLTEVQFGIHATLHSDVMGPSFAPKELHVTYRPAGDDQKYSQTFGCPIFFEQPENKFLFDGTWLDRTPKLGSEVTYSSMVSLCEDLLEELHLSAGLTGEVRQALLVNLARPTSLEAIAGHLNMTARTLRRRLHEQNTSYRQLLDELMMHMAIKYFRDTTLTVEDVAHSLGYSDAANFRHAFRRWTSTTPDQFKSISRAGFGK
jgi:AraC-like DNA-binding protein